MAHASNDMSWDDVVSPTESNNNDESGNSELKSSNSNEIQSYPHEHCHGDYSHDDEYEDEESAHFNKIVDAFLFYRRHSEEKLRSKIRSVLALPENHRALIPNFRDHLRRIHRCVVKNYAFLQAVVLATGRIFENQHDRSSNSGNTDYLPIATDFNMDKLQSTLRQIVRDWSSIGAIERRQCYEPILNRLVQIWPLESERKDVRILVPGAGLGRFAFDVAKLGFECQGNEFSLFMLFVSNFILNRCKTVDEWIIYPYVHQWTNNWTYENQLKEIRFPDVNPGGLGPNSSFSMSAGDFLDVYGRKMEENAEKWDAVATVFFIDTAHDVIAYLKIIHRILKPGGYWINLGPLLYHFTDVDNEISLELPYDELLNVAKKLGFEILENSKMTTTYTQNISSMLRYEYECAYTVFRKNLGV